MASEEKYLIVGSEGLLGSSLSMYLKSVDSPVVETTIQKETVSEKRLYLNLLDDISGWEPPGGITAAFLFSAITSQEECRKKPERTRLINVERTCELALKLNERGIFVVFPSTNLVFDGSMPASGTNDPTAPQTEYARQKVETEQGLEALGSNRAIVRFTKIVHSEMPLIRGWMDSLISGVTINPFSDMIFSPVPLIFCIEVIHKVAAQRLHGILHVSGDEDISYAQAARHIADRIGADRRLVRPVRTEEVLPDIEHLPTNTTLDTERLRYDLGMEPPGAFEALDIAFGLDVNE